MIACGCEVCSSLDFRDKRFRTSAFLEVSGVNLVIDTGPDFRLQMLREKVMHLDAVLFTHEHKDHTAGLDDVRSFNFIQKCDMPVYGRKEVMDHLKQEFPYIFNNKSYPGVPRVNLNEIKNEPFHVKGVEIQPIQMYHYKLPVFGYRLGGFTYITDTNKIPEEEFKKIEGTKTLVINALQHEPHISHFNLAQALEVIGKIKPERAYLTHISHKLGCHEEVSKQLPNNVLLAYDGLKIEI